MKLLPLEGTKPPAKQDRPKCRHCGRTLEPVIRTRYEREDFDPANGSTGFHTTAVARYWTGKYGRYGDNLFCGLNHGYEYGLTKARKGGA